MQVVVQTFVEESVGSVRSKKLVQEKITQESIGYCKFLVQVFWASFRGQISHTDY